MNILTLVRILGILTGVIGAFMLLPVGAGLFYGEGDWDKFLVVALGSMGVGGMMAFIGRNATEVSERDGFVLVTAVWLTAMGVGGLPFYLSGAVPTLTDGFFEAMSGFTTTGASVLYDYGHITHTVFLWRSLTHWIGGMGIIVLALVILPALGIGGMELFKREVSGPYSDKLTPRIRDTAKALWGVYVALTFAEFLVLMGAGMGPFDAINHSMASLATGGFSTRETSIMEYHSPLIEWVIIFFMLLGGMNFSLHYRFLTGGGSLKVYLQDTEWRWYVLGLGAASLAMAVYLFLVNGYTVSGSLTKSTFQAVSINTTTGFASDDYVKWGAFPQIILLMLMLVGGMAGSTSGGLKWIRLLLMFKFSRIEMIRLVHPNAVVHAKVGKTRVHPAVLNNIFGFFFLYLTVLIGATLLLALDGNSILASFSGAVSALGNVGPGLEALGPMENFSRLSDSSKWVLTLCMLLGRLELMTVFVILMPSTWVR